MSLSRCRPADRRTCWRWPARSDRAGRLGFLPRDAALEVCRPTAGATQLLVLIALLAVEGIAVAATLELVATGVLRRP